MPRRHLSNNNKGYIIMHMNRRTVFGIIIVLTLAFGLLSTALAHAELVSSDPAAGAKLTKAPAKIILASDVTGASRKARDKGEPDEAERNGSSSSPRLYPTWNCWSATRSMLRWRRRETDYLSIQLCCK